ncbi:hypothetical protein H7K45_27875 [Mycobacterium yunnanensis]|uniref:Uncharacterized protein n=1 Tax=Mycobacterium yunnanensis TaxID=368477 RepID=A0A9X3BWI1_9MYCO|nr:hypothetical protein [Mycobacterium yunnanensis]MCV7424370.1 hypothetical protein [Mycobacterium yunnanensis]
MTYPPNEIARGDQHYASVGEGLDSLIDAFNCSEDHTQLERLDAMGAWLANPDRGDGVTLTTLEHAGTLANLLVVAIARLAAHV